MTPQQANDLANRRGVRHVPIGGGMTCIGVWADQDSAQLREALKIIGTAHLEIRYLDVEGNGIPDKFRARLVPGPRLSLDIVQAMMRSTVPPWTIRDKMLADRREQERAA